MANKRIKDLGTTASTLAADDYIAVDGNANGTRKIVKGDLVNDISTQVAGTYLDEANNLSDVASKDTSKLNLEVPNVGVSPNEVPLSGQLGTMAFQDASGVSVGQLEAEALEVTDKITTKDVGGVTKGQVEFQDSGYTISGGSNLGDIRHDAPRHRWYSGATVLAQFDEGTSYFQNTSVGIGDASPGGKLTIETGSGNGLQLYRSAANANFDAITFRDTTNSATNGRIGFNANELRLEGTNDISFNTGGSETAVIDSSGRLGVGQSTPGNFNAAADDLVVGNSSGNRGITITTGDSSNGYIVFGDATSGANMRGRLAYDHSSDQLYLGAGGATNWKIDGSTGNLIAVQSGNGINFGVVPTSGPSPSSSTLSDYEEGTFTPQIADATSGGNVGSAATALGSYTKVGRVVHFSIVLSTIDTTGMTSGNTFYVRNLPFVQSSGGTPAQLSVKTDDVTFADGIVSSIVGGQSNLYLVSLRSNNSDVNRQVGHLTSGAADVLISGTYIAA